MSKWQKADGTLNFDALDQLEDNLRAVTDNMSGIDRVLKQAKLGQDMDLAFLCGHSGAYFPGDYLKLWGKRYGIGLGEDPVSECLDSDYDTAPPAITPETRSIEQIMHPLRVSFAQVDLEWVVPKQVDYLIPAWEDPWMEKRSQLVRAKQLKHPRSRIRNMMAAWETSGRS